MNSSYKELIDVITSQWGNRGVVVTPDAGDTDSDTCVGAYVPAKLLPSASCLTLPPGGEFLSSIGSEASRIDADWTFLLLPWGTWRDIPAQFQEVYRGYSLQDACLEEFVKGVRQSMHFAVLLPESFFIGNRTRRVREKLFGYSGLSVHPTLTEDVASSKRLRCRPELVMWHDLPLGEFGLQGIHASFRAHTLVCRIGEKPDALRFFRTKTTAPGTKPGDAAAELKLLLRMEGGHTRNGNGYVLRNDIDAGSKLSFDLHSPATKEKLREMQTLGKVVTFGDIFESLPCRLHSVLAWKRFHQERADGFVPVIGGRQITPEGLIDFEHAARYVDPTDLELLKTGDICIRRIGNLKVGDPLAAAVVKSGMPAAAFDSNVIAVRPRTQLPQEQVEFYMAYLRSGLATNFLLAKGARVTLDQLNLENMPLPVPGDDLQLALQELSEVERTLADWQRSIARARSELFSFNAIEESRDTIRSVGRRLRERVSTGLQVDNMAFRARTMFPLPVSFRWRTVLSAEPNLEGYRCVLSCAEVITCYLALMGLAVVRKHGQEIQYLKTLRARFSECRGGTNFGDWLAILQEMSGKKGAMKKVAEEAGLPELFTFWGEPEVSEAIAEIKKLRDDDAHDRGPKTPKKIHEAFEAARTHLDTLVEGVGFLSDYRLVFIEDVMYDSLSGMSKYSFRELRGDHPMVALQTGGTHQGADLEKGSLYVVDPTGAKYLLRPYITRSFCDKCGNCSTFYLDCRERNSGVVVLKSMEHGHPLESDDIADALAQAGMLDGEDQ